MEEINNNIIDNQDNEQKKRGRPKKENKADKYDIILCDVCNKNFKRNNRHNHKKTKYHILHKQFYDTIKNNIVIEDSKAKNFNDIIKYPCRDNKGNTIYLTNKQQNFYNKFLE